MSSDDRTFGACPVPLHERERIVLGHGSGGVLTSELLERVFLPAFSNPVLARMDDQAVLEIPGLSSGGLDGERRGARLAFTTDSFVVTPIFFPGGDIGRLAVHGTVNDLAMSGACPLYLSAAFILEEGLLMADLERVVASMRDAAREAGVTIVTGDTKVVGKGSGDQLFITTTGIGLVPPGVSISAARAPGDAILLSGTIGDHGMAVLAARQDLGLEGRIESDTAALHDLVATMLEARRDLHVLRDPTRGGVATTVSEIAIFAQVGVELREDRFAVREEVRGACELLGFDPLYVANEGKLIAIVAPEDADAVLAAMRSHPRGRDAVCIGEIVAEHPGVVVLRTGIGGSRVLERPYGELLPRIC